MTTLEAGLSVEQRASRLQNAAAAIPSKAIEPEGVDISFLRVRVVKKREEWGGISRAWELIPQRTVRLTRTAASRQPGQWTKNEPQASAEAFQQFCQGEIQLRAQVAFESLRCWCEENRAEGFALTAANRAAWLAVASQAGAPLQSFNGIN